MCVYFCRKKGYIYQYFYPSLYKQDLEGYLNINHSGNLGEVTGGLCQDFFGFREVDY